MYNLPESRSVSDAPSRYESECLRAASRRPGVIAIATSPFQLIVQVVSSGAFVAAPPASDG